MATHYDDLKRIEVEHGGRIKFLVCPHIEAGKMMNKYHPWIKLTDDTNGSVQLVLCEQCYKVVAGDLAADLYQAVESQRLKEKRLVIEPNRRKVHQSR